MDKYSVGEGANITVKIVRENSLESSQGFSVILLLKSGSNATEGRCYIYYKPALAAQSSIPSCFTIMYAGEDYLLYDGTTQFSLHNGANQTILFDQSEMSKDITVTGVQDNIGEGDEVIILDLITDERNVISVSIGQRETQIMIMEDDCKCIRYLNEQE